MDYACGWFTVSIRHVSQEYRIERYCVSFRTTLSTLYNTFGVVNAVIAGRPSNQSTHQMAAFTSSSRASVLTTLVEGITREENNWREENNMEQTIWARLEVAGRTLMALSFVLFCMKLLHFYAISRQLGPKLVMIWKMVCSWCRSPSRIHIQRVL